MTLTPAQPDGPQPPSPAFLDAAICAVAGIYGLGCVAWMVSTSAFRGTESLATLLASVPLVMLATHLVFRLSRLPIETWPHRLAWRLTALAGVLLICTDLLAAFDLVFSDGRSAGWVHAGYLPCFPMIICALLLLPQAVRSVREATGLVLDTAMVMVAAGMFIWQYPLRAVLESDLGGTFPRSLAAAYLGGDLLMIGGITTVLLRCPRGPRRLPLLLISASLSAVVLADLLRDPTSLPGRAGAGLLQHVGYIVHYLLFIAAAVVESRRLSDGRDDVEDLTPRPLTVVPYAAVAAACALLVTVAANASADGPGGLMPLVLATSALMGLVLARHVLVVRETTRLVRDRTLRASDARFKSLVQHAPEVVAIVDSSWIITFVNPSATSTLGYRATHLVGLSALDLLHPEDVSDAVNRLRESMAAPGRSIATRWRMRRSDHTFIETETLCTNLCADENVRGLVLTVRDVSDRCSLEAQLVHQAFHDPLTGLANRALFQDRVQHALARRREDSDRLGIVFLDLDHFKAVNDNLGHATGDALLKGAAQRLVGGLRAFDTAARLGGDEFAVLVDDISRDEEVTHVADRITRAFREPFTIDGAEITATASVGVALASPGQTAEDLLRNADLAMYLSKNRGRGQFALFEPAMHTAAMSRLELQKDLRHALARGELSLLYQPIHELDSQAIVGAEALLRWVHPTRGPIPPKTFVPMAEETGAIVEIGQWVFRTACRDAQTWRVGRGGRPLRVSINLSRRELSEPKLFDHVHEAVRESGLLPGAIVLELTESTLLDYSDRTPELMHRLKTLGVRLAIDDFGTGYSSLNHLQRLPIDFLKIDRVFVDAIASDVHASALARTIVGLGESMSLHIIAEGIETAEQVERLRALGCDYGQGFFFGAPMAADDFAAHVERSEELTLA